MAAGRSALFVVPTPHAMPDVQSAVGQTIPAARSQVRAGEQEARPRQQDGAGSPATPGAQPGRLIAFFRQKAKEQP